MSVYFKAGLDLEGSLGGGDIHVFRFRPINFF